MVIDEGTELGARAARRLREEHVVWLTTVTPARAPLPRPVGFLWDGGDVVVLAGIAELDPGAPAPDAFPAWLEKYTAQIAEFGMTPASYAARFSVPIRIRLTRLAGR